MAAVKRALISLSDKTGVVDFARSLTDLGVEILSTGGTAKLLADAGVAVIEVADYTGFPEMLDGRVKTLHPKIHGGILGRRDLPEHVAKMAEHEIGNIDMVCVNLYPFAATIAKPGCTLEDAIENIDIGGPTMVRSAAKNWKHVAIITDNADFAAVIEELQQNGGKLGDKTRFNLSRKAFSHTAQYDGMISNYLTSVSDDKLAGEPEIREFPEQFNQSWLKVQEMRYGENPHQQAAFYRDLYPAPGCLSAYQQLQGKELSYNNIADADAAWEAVKAFDAPACVIVKHANPCGVAVADTPLNAYKLAFATDTTSAFGGIIALNRPLDRAAAEHIVKQIPHLADQVRWLDRDALRASEPAVTQQANGALEFLCDHQVSPFRLGDAFMEAARQNGVDLYPNVNVTGVLHEGSRIKGVRKKLSQEIAEKVAQTGKPFSMEPMNPFERRLVHMALQDHEHVMTKSEGQGAFRKVKVYPRTTQK